MKKLISIMLLCLLCLSAGCVQFIAELPDGTRLQVNTLGKDINIKKLSVPGKVDMEGYTGESQEATVITGAGIIMTEQEK